MTALFADTFYWIALTDFTDSAHERALSITSERATSSIVTTDEVLAEYLTFFANAHERMRREVAGSVQGILVNRTFRVTALTDCISMQTMAERRLERGSYQRPAFKQEGFRALLRDL